MKLNNNSLLTRAKLFLRDRGGGVKAFQIDLGRNEGEREQTG